MNEHSPEVTPEQVRAAEATEQAALEEAQRIHMRKRVVLLRVQLDRTQEELAAAREQIRLLREQREGAEEAPEPSVH